MKIELTQEDIWYLHDCVDSDVECLERELDEANAQYRTADAVDIEESIQHCNNVLAKLDEHSPHTRDFSHVRVHAMPVGETSLWKQIVEGLPSEPTRSIWSDGNYILCRTESMANAIADLLDSLYATLGQNASSVTGFFEPKDDLHSGEVDALTGWWYVDIDG